MKNYVLVYRESAPSARTDDASQAWGVWFGSLGSKLVDAGNPFGGGKSLTVSGVGEITNAPVTGYSIVKAETMDEALDLAKGCPLVTHSETASIEVYETLPM